MSKDEAFWDFALRVYGRQGVAAACIGFQDAHDLDVNVILMILWAEATKQGLKDTSFWQKVVPMSSVWQGEIVGPLRQSRRHLKEIKEAGASYESLKSAILKAELEAEKIEIDWLEACLTAAAQDASESGTAGEMLGAYLAALGEMVTPDILQEFNALQELALKN